MGQLGITLDEQAIEKLAWMCTFEGRRTIGSFKVLGLEEIKDIYRGGPISCSWKNAVAYRFRYATVFY